MLQAARRRWEGDRLGLPEEQLGQRGIKQVVRGTAEDPVLVVSFVTFLGDLCVYPLLGVDAPLSDDAFV